MAAACRGQHRAATRTRVGRARRSVSASCAWSTCIRRSAATSSWPASCRPAASPTSASTRSSPTPSTPPRPRRWPGWRRWPTPAEEGGRGFFGRRRAVDTGLARALPRRGLRCRQDAPDRRPLARQSRPRRLPDLRRADRSDRLHRHGRRRRGLRQAPPPLPRRVRAGRRRQHADDRDLPAPGPGRGRRPGGDHVQLAARPTGGGPLQRRRLPSRDRRHRRALRRRAHRRPGRPGPSDRPAGDRHRHRGRPGPRRHGPGDRLDGLLR